MRWNYLNQSFIFIVCCVVIIGIGCGPSPNSGGDTAVSLQNNGSPPDETPNSDALINAPATFTPVPTSDIIPTETPQILPKSTDEPEDLPQATAVYTPTPTSEPLYTPDVVVVVDPEEGVPTAVPEFEVPEETTTMLLLGNDGGINTDTIIIAAINKEGPTASILSLPRDLYIYIPFHGMGRINTVMARGGPELLKQTIQYNFGVPIHFYAQVDFDGFKETVDILDTVEIAVSCELQDWRLKSPELDPEDEDNWEQFLLEPGVHQMDGDMALWYVRSRKTTSDFDRGRRQQQLIRAMLNQAVDVGALSDFPSLWSTYQTYVSTDMDIGRVLQIASIAPAIRENGVQHLYVAQKTESWVAPDGANVLLPVWEGERKMEEEFSRLFLPPALNMAAQEPITVEILNASGNPDLTALAADNLAWFGFTAVDGGSAAETSKTQLRYFHSNFKGSFDWLISWIFDMEGSDIELADEEDYKFDYQLIIGKDYDPCRPRMLAPQLFLNQTP
ncbi:MAG: LCP family protein [Chloroflexota bacterium]